jgi:hypothetical protein
VKRLALAVLLLAATTYALPGAVADAPGPSLGCGLTAVADPTATGTYVGVLSGGPATTGSTGALMCGVVVGGPGDYTPVPTILVSASGTAAVVLPPTPVNYAAAPTDQVWLCTAWSSSSGTLVLDDSTGTWTPSPTARCARVTNVAGVAHAGPSRVVQGPVPSANGCRTASGVTACAAYVTGSVTDSYPVTGPGATNVAVAGYVDLYRFTLPNGGVTTLPCVVLTAGTSANACASAGGTFVSRTATLADTSVAAPTTSLTTPVATVRVCSATLVLTVNDVGINSFPAYAVC